MKKVKKTVNTVGQYPVLLQEDISGGYWVSCPVFEGCYSQGETMDDALKNIREAIELCLEDLPNKKRYFPRNVSLHMVSI